MDGIFSRESSEYKRNIDPINHYVEQASLYISKVKNIPLHQATRLITTLMQNDKDNSNNLFNRKTNRVIRFAERQDNGDRIEKRDSITNYISTAIKNKDIIAPTLTTYININTERALTVDIVINNKNERSVYKKEMFKYIESDPIKYSYYFNVQNNKKLFNNAMSGGMTSPSTPIYNKTGHSTLTSGCRNTSSFANANNEKILTGNRHYYTVDIILNNIIYIVKYIDQDKIKSVIEKYNLYVPTVDDCINVVLRSSMLYLIDESRLKKVRSLFNTLSDIERAGFVYSNDFYHLCIFNESLFKGIIDKATQVVYDDSEYSKDDLKKLPEEYVMAGSQICYEKLKTNDKDLYKYLVPSVTNMYNTIKEYRDIFNTFFNTDIIPNSVAYFPQSVRRCIMTSDTDSSIFTSQELVFWYLGEEKFDNAKGRAVQGLLVAMVSMTTEHTLCQMSANFGIDESMLREIYMKNEYTFDSYFVTGISKHYFASMSVREGKVFEKLEREIKGSQLKSANLPGAIKDSALKLIDELIDCSLENKKISIEETLYKIYDIEQSLIKHIQNGDMEYFKTYTIKGSDSYKDDRFNPSQYFTLWNSSFGLIYGPIEVTPYQSIKVSTILGSSVKLNEWIGSLQSPIKEAVQEWFSLNKRKDLPMISLPMEIVRSKGMPKEILPIIDYKAMVHEICNLFYLVLETIGFYLKSGCIVSDYFEGLSNGITKY